ncbi:stomatin/prohibitin-family membrane protease subunit [Rhodanobacter sp. Root561]|uniref:slipin family protein n=1 Tax=Rhodanobacter sp. Root561 TaxID=1736560 RepID=UPI0006F214AE|nr:slipin family protein [Rhodanobacter sp. Root561]KQZ80176.1 stomatin/prohibitin-family membrane protease subunit [Rhodanobacter sp. Root561]
MFWLKQIVIGDGERGLLYRNRRFERVLSPGVHRLFDPRKRIAVTVHNLTRPEYAGSDAEVLMAQMDGPLAECFLVADIGTDQVGLVLKNGKLEDVLAPGTRKLYWKGIVPVEVQAVSLVETLEIDAHVASRLRQLGVLGKVAVTVDVPVESTGLLFVDNKLVRTLAPGAWAFWNFRKNVAAEVIELRVQSLEVSGQELLTRDKVSLRVNLAASLRVTDPVAARTKVAKYGDYLYRELQYGLRKAVSGKTLDELLGDKASLDADIFAYVRGRVVELGIEVLGVGVKDVILPGEMKDILNSVVQAEKAAQANVIRRREEANATRSLLNTARLIEESPVLMRLKELEALEKVTEKIDKLTVFGGLDGVLNQLVSLKA